MNVLLFGATGMVGSGLLLECIEDPLISRIRVIGRRTCGMKHEKVDEVITSDFYDYSEIEDQLTGFDACFFCIGVSSVGKSEEEYRHLTYDLTMAAAETLLRLNPEMTFCYVSAGGADPSGKSRQMWARVRGELENALAELPFKELYIFRPLYIQPVSGVQSSVKLYRILYATLAPLYPLLKRLIPGHVTTTRTLGQAMIAAALNGAPERVLESREINQIGGTGNR